MDRYLITGALLLLALEVSYLLTGLNGSTRDAATSRSAETRALGEMERASQQVRRRSPASLVWNESHAHDALYEQDSILTLDGSSATLVLEGDTRLNLDENSLVVLEARQKAPADGSLRIRFSRGGLRSRASRRAVSIDEGSIVLSADKGSDLSLKKLDDGRVTIEVAAGHASIQSAALGSAPEKVEAGEKIFLRDDRIEERKKLSDALSWAKELPTRIYVRRLPAIVPLAWSGSAETIRILTPAKKLESRPVDQRSEIKLEIGEGGYSFSLARGEKDAEESRAHELQVRLVKATRYFAPLPRDRVIADRPVNFSWEPIPDAASYRWELARDSEFEKLVATRVTTEPRLQMTLPTTGAHHWRVVGLDADALEIPAPRAFPIFVLREPLPSPKLSAPVLASPELDPIELAPPEIRQPAADPPDGADNQSATPRAGAWYELLRWLFPEARAAGRAPAESLEAVFAWQEVVGADHYVIEISATPGFEEPLVSARTQRTNYRWTRFPRGVYFWRVAGERDGEPGLFSDVSMVNLAEIDRTSTAKAGGMNVIVSSRPQLPAGSAPNGSANAQASTPKRSAPAPLPESHVTSRDAVEEAAIHAPRSWGRFTYRPIYRLETLRNEKDVEGHLNGIVPLSFEIELGSSAVSSSGWGLSAGFDHTVWKPRSGLAQNELDETRIRADLFYKWNASWALGAGAETIPVLTRANTEDALLESRWAYGPLLVYSHALGASSELELALKVRAGAGVAGGGVALSHRWILADRADGSAFFAGPHLRYGRYQGGEIKIEETQLSLELGFLW